MVKATIVGSILSNALLVLGLAFVVGGLKHGRQRFAADDGRTLGLMFTLAVFILADPVAHRCAAHPGRNRTSGRCRWSSPSSCWCCSHSRCRPRWENGIPPRIPVEHPRASSPIVASPDSAKAASVATAHGEWPLVMAIGMLAVAGVGAAFVSEWFVAALEPAMDAAGINEVFAGLVIVAIAGNAVENFVGIQLAAKNQMDYAVQVILQSPVQIALTIAPIICLAAAWLGQPGFDLVFSPLLLAVDDHVGTGRGAGDLRRRIDLVRGGGAERALRGDRHVVLVGLSASTV